jgi:hypothetical protein
MDSGERSATDTPISHCPPSPMRGAVAGISRHAMICSSENRFRFISSPIRDREREVAEVRSRLARRKAPLGSETLASRVRRGLSDLGNMFRSSPEDARKALGALLGEETPPPSQERPRERLLGLRRGAAVLQWYRGQDSNLHVQRTVAPKATASTSSATPASDPLDSRRWDRFYLAGSIGLGLERHADDAVISSVPDRAKRENSRRIVLEVSMASDVPGISPPHSLPAYPVISIRSPARTVRPHAREVWLVSARGIEPRT